MNNRAQIDKPQRGRPKRAELPGVNINTGAQSINTERAGKTRLVLLSPYILNKVVNKVCLFFQIILGVVQSASSRMETVGEIRKRLQDVLKVVPADRLIVSPDCGLAYLPTDLAKQKLKNMMEAANSLP